MSEQSSDSRTSDPVRVVPCLWFDDQGEEAAGCYAEIFPDARILVTAPYPESFDNPSGLPRGSVMTVELEVAGRQLTLLNGGPHFTINPSISFFVYTDSAEETDRIAGALAEGGSYLMEPGEYPWSPRYAWVQDRYGVSWQVMFSDDGAAAPRIVPCLMFVGDVHGRAAEALRHYAEVFPRSDVEALVPYEADEGPEGAIKHGRASLDGNTLVAMDGHGAHGFGFNEGVSLQVMCRDQDEIDHYWSRLSEDGQEGPCGWLKDRFGVSWQVVPIAFIDMFREGGGAGAGYQRAFQAMLQMKKLDIAALRAAFEGSGDANPSGR